MAQETNEHPQQHTPQPLTSKQLDATGVDAAENAPAPTSPGMC
jgi:hypothetical protein